MVQIFVRVKVRDNATKKCRNFGKMLKFPNFRKCVREWFYESGQMSEVAGNAFRTTYGPFGCILLSCARVFVRKCPVVFGGACVVISGL